MIFLLCWCVFGFFVGIIAKLLYPVKSKSLPTIAVGVIGSLIGGSINWFLGMGGPFHPAGFFMSILGGIVLLAVWSHYA